MQMATLHMHRIFLVNAVPQVGLLCHCWSPAPLAAGDAGEWVLCVTRRSPSLPRRPMSQARRRDFAAQTRTLAQTGRTAQWGNATNSAAKPMAAAQLVGLPASRRPLRARRWCGMRRAWQRWNAAGLLRPRAPALPPSALLCCRRRLRTPRSSKWCSPPPDRTGFPEWRSRGPKLC